MKYLNLISTPEISYAVLCDAKCIRGTNHIQFINDCQTQISTLGLWQNLCLNRLEDTNEFIQRITPKDKNYTK